MRIVEPFIDYLDDVTREALRSDKQIIIVGDLNCDCLDESAAQTIALTTNFTDMCIPHFFLASERRSTVNVRRRPGYKIWRLFKFSSILLSFKTRYWLFILIYINFGKFKLEKAPNFVTRPASNVDRRPSFGSEKKMRNAHISEMRSKEFLNVYKLTQLIREPTRSTASSESLTDLLITSSPQLFWSTGVLQSGFSDHSPIFGSLISARQKDIIANLSKA
jgi:hypothetical protein